VTSANLFFYGHRGIETFPPEFFIYEKTQNGASYNIGEMPRKIFTEGREDQRLALSRSESVASSSASLAKGRLIF
jgi:hypothetical protein